MQRNRNVRIERSPQLPRREHDPVIAAGRGSGASGRPRARSGRVRADPAAAPDGFTGDLFGSSVAVSGNTLIVGSPNDDVGGITDRGSAYVYVRNGSTWSFQQQLVAPNSEAGANDYFGFRVALDGDNFGTVTDVGSAYTFVRNPATGTWSLQSQHLDTGDPQPGDHYGWSVAVDGDTEIVGEPDDDVLPPVGGRNADQGSAFVYVRSGATWSLQTQLTETLGSDVFAGDGEKFGEAVALDGDTAIVSAAHHNLNGLNDVGVVYAFVRSGTTWTKQTPRMTANDGAGDDLFGASLALSGDTALVGVPYDDGTVEDAGSAYAFVRSGGVWTQQRKFTETESYHGYLWNAVGLFGDTAVIGWPNIPGVQLGTDARGAAEIYIRSGATWAKQQDLRPADASDGDLFGYAVGFDGSAAVIGAVRDDETYTDQGSAYVYVPSPPTAVAVTSLSAWRTGHGVVLRWRSGDPALLGFRLYREQVPIGNLIPATRSAYRHVDADAPSGAIRYRIRAVRRDGTAFFAAARTVGVS